MKKLVALILALSLVMSFAVAFAVETEGAAAGAEASDATTVAVEDGGEDAAGEGEEAAAEGEDAAGEGEEAAGEGEEAAAGEGEEAIPQEIADANTVPAGSVEIVAGSDASSVIINGIEYVYVCFTTEAYQRAGGTPVFWARIYENDAYLFSMTTGAFLGKFATKDLSYVNFVVDSYMLVGQAHSVPLLRAA